MMNRDTHSSDAGSQSLCTASEDGNGVQGFPSVLGIYQSVRGKPQKTYFTVVAVPTGLPTSNLTSIRYKHDGFEVPRSVTAVNTERCSSGIRILIKRIPWTESASELYTDRFRGPGSIPGAATFSE
jgi:hypothetical protein